MPRLNIQKGIKLAPYTTFKIGGSAKYFFEAKTEKDLILAIKWTKEKNLPYFILGGGSNILVADEGYEGLVIKIQNPKSPPTPRLRRAGKIQIKSKIQNPRIYVKAGVPLALAVLKAAKNGLTGFEWAIGIPGTVGGAIVGNAGAFGGSMKDVVRSVEILEIIDYKIPNSKFQTKILRNKDCGFSYRDSIFKHKKNLIILSAEIQLKKGNSGKIKKKMEEYLEKRKKTQPLNRPSAGCAFKNLQLTTYNLQLLKGHLEFEKFKKRGMIPAGWLIEKVGLKGKRIGRAKISQKHANFIVNLGGAPHQNKFGTGQAKAKDVFALINLVKKRVKDKFKIELKEEVTILATPAPNLLKIILKKKIFTNQSPSAFLS